MKRLLILLVALHLIAGSVDGAELSLRPKAEIGASIVRLGDIVDIVGTSDAEVQELAAIPLVPAPAPGTQQFLTVAQIRDLLAASGVNMGTLQFRGAAAVAIDSPTIVAPQPEPTPAQPPLSDEANIDEHLTAAIVEHLRSQTGHDMWEVALVPDNKLADAWLRAGNQVTLVGGRAPWTGRQQFELQGPGLDRKAYVYATVERLQLVVFAIRPIAMGEFVRATDVEVRTYAGNVSVRAIGSLDQVVGKEATQAIRPESMLLANQVRSPLLVRRGERVSVRARAAGVTVRTYGTAQQDGSLGDLIQVQSLEGRDRYAARVFGVRELEVFAAGATAADVSHFGQ